MHLFHRQTHNPSDTLIGFLAGAAVGAAVALLFAPQSGVRTRRLLNKKAEDAKCALTESFENLQESAQHAREVVELGVQRGMKTASGFLQQARHQARARA